MAQMIFGFAIERRRAEPLIFMRDSPGNNFAGSAARSSANGPKLMKERKLFGDEGVALDSN
jgi:hypothetical protein